MLGLIKEVGTGAAGAVLGALILPELASSLVGGLGMIAAAGAVSACFSLCGIFCFLGSITAISYLLPTEQKLALAAIIDNNPTLSNLTAMSLAIGIFVASIFAASIVMGQAFLPLLACTALGSVIVGLGLGLISSIFSPSNESKPENNPSSILGINFN